VQRSGARDADGNLPPEVWAERLIAPTLSPADLTSEHRAVELITDGVIVRRLTPLETCRLQGYPDGHTATSDGNPQSDSAQYKQHGNGIAVPMFAWIAKRIAAVDQESAA
jgi:site-specific DNA-cytosine methylase